MAMLLDEWASAAAGKGRTAIVSGEPGIGKSRLVLELKAHVRRQRAGVLRFQCSPNHEASLLHPLLERLRRFALPYRNGDQAADRADDPGMSDARERLKTLLRGVGPENDAAVALLAGLMAPAEAAGAEVPQAEAQRSRSLLLEALVADVRRMAQERPLLLLVEDAHWIDPSSQQLLALIVERMQSSAFLLVVTCRPPFRPAWEQGTTRIELGPLAAADAETLVRHIPGGESLSQSLIAAIVARSDGVPFFLEELARAVVEASQSASVPSAGGPAAPLAIPPTLQASLLARLDRIGPSREVAKVAAALGREFSLALLGAVLADRDEGALRQEMQRLVAADLLVPVASATHEAFAFRHALIQDTAYGTLLRGERRALHERIARVIEARFPDLAATQPEIVASHFNRAELWEPAARCWLEAGRRAVRGWALTEAARHLSEGLRAAGLLPPSTERERLELELNMALGPVMMGASGYASEESLEVFRRAEPLVKAVGSVSERLLTMLGLFNVHYGRGELAQALSVAHEYGALARAEGVNVGCAHVLLGQTHAAMAQFPDAAREFARGLEVCAETGEDFASLDVFASPPVVALALGAGVHFALGRPEDGRSALAEAIARARQTRHPLSIALALVTNLLTPVPGGLDPDPARAEEVARFCAEHGLTNFQAWAEFARGAIIARRDDPRSGIAVMCAAIRTAEAMCSRLFRPTQLGTLASAHAKLGETERALFLVEEALSISASTGERRADPSLHRLRSEIFINTGRRRAGIEALQRSLAVARSQHNKAEEARAVATLARLQQGRLLADRLWTVPLEALRGLLGRLVSR